MLLEQFSTKTLLKNNLNHAPVIMLNVKFSEKAGRSHYWFTIDPSKNKVFILHHNDEEREAVREILRIVFLLIRILTSHDYEQH